MNQENSKIERRKLEIEYEVFLGHSIFQREGAITRTVKVCVVYKTLTTKTRFNRLIMLQD